MFYAKTAISHTKSVCDLGKKGEGYSFINLIPHVGPLEKIDIKT